MNTIFASNKILKNNWIANILILLILAAAALLGWWTIQRADTNLREDLLKQTRLISQGINPADLLTLSGNATDLKNPNYLKIKAQFASIKQTNERCRFIYLMGQKSNGDVFIFLDNEPVTSRDYSPPGLIYDDASRELKSSFTLGGAFVEGPLPDEWGVWVSALVPILDPLTGKTLAMLGMDIDAKTWKSDIAAHTALPIALIFLLLVGTITLIAPKKERLDDSVKPVMQRLMPPLVATLILMALTTSMLLWQQYNSQNTQQTTEKDTKILADLHNSIKDQTLGIAAATEILAQDPRVISALSNKETDSFYKDWFPVFERLQKEQNISYFHFIDKDRMALARIHNPKIKGDKINRFTLLEAERTEKTASGLELGPLATPTIHVVTPVYSNKTLVGYIELGKEIDDIVESIKTSTQTELTLSIHKDAIDREAWITGMRNLGRDANWNRMPYSVITYSTLVFLPDPFIQMANRAPQTSFPKDNSYSNVSFDEKTWHVSKKPLLDAAGEEIGSLLMTRDISAERATFLKRIVLGTVVCALLLISLISVFYFLFKKTDENIRTQLANK